MIQNKFDKDVDYLYTKIYKIFIELKKTYKSGEREHAQKSED